MIEIKLENKPIPVPLAFQPIFKMAILLAILKYCCEKPHKATFLKLHLCMWALRSPKHKRLLREVKFKKRSSLIPWSFEPALEQVVKLCLVNQYCKKVKTSNSLQIQLETKGKMFLSQIEVQKYFKEEIDKLKEIGIVPQSIIDSANSIWTTK